MIARVSLLPVALVLAWGPAGASPLVARETKANAAVVADALRAVDQALAAFEQRMHGETSPVTQAAMKTRLVVLKQRRVELEKRFTAERHAALLTDLSKEVNVTATQAPAVDPNEGRARPTVRLEDMPPSAVEAHRADAAAARLKDEAFHAARAAELASQRRLEIARLDAELARLTARVDAATVGDASRRAELNQRLRELELERRRLELAPDPARLNQLQLEIERELERTRP